MVPRQGQGARRSGSVEARSPTQRFARGVLILQRAAHRQGTLPVASERAGAPCWSEWILEARKVVLAGRSCPGTAQVGLDSACCKFVCPGDALLCCEGKSTDELEGRRPSTEGERREEEQGRRKRGRTEAGRVGQSSSRALIAPSRVLVVVALRRSFESFASRSLAQKGL